MAVSISAMARYTGMTESLGEGASANSIEGTCWHITNRINMTVIADVSGIEWIPPSGIGIAELRWRVIEVGRDGVSGGSMDCWERISRTVVDPTCMAIPVASSNRIIVDSVRRLLALGVNDGIMRFQ